MGLSKTSPLPGYKTLDAGARHMDTLRERAGAHAERNENLLAQKFAGMYGRIDRTYHVMRRQGSR